MKRRQAKKIVKRWGALYEAGKALPWPSHTLRRVRVREYRTGLARYKQWVRSLEGTVLKLTGQVVKVELRVAVQEDAA